MSKSPEIQAISRVLEFSNIREVESAEQVYDLFQPKTTPPFRLAVIRDSADGGMDLQEVGGVRVEVRDGTPLTPEQALALHREWHASTRAMLAQIASRRPAAARREFGKRFTDALKRGVMIGQARFDGKVLAQNSRYDGPVDAQVAFGLALLLDAELGFTKMLRRCRWKPCGVFFLHRKRGQPPIVCTECRKSKSDYMRDYGKRRKRKQREQGDVS